MTTNRIDWTRDNTADLLECLRDYSAAAAIAPGTPSGDDYAMHAADVRAELVRRGVCA